MMRTPLLLVSKALFLVFFTIGLNSLIKNPTHSGIHTEPVEENKALVRKYFEEAVNNRKVELVDEIFDENYHSVLLDSGEAEGTGSHQIKNFLPYLFEAFPDIHFELVNLIGEGDKVVAHSRTTGTHKAEFWGYPATYNPIVIHEIFIFTVKNGKIVSNQRLADLKSLFEQLGK